jgi:hypothetical protein
LLTISLLNHDNNQQYMQKTLLFIFLFCEVFFFHSLKTFVMLICFQVYVNFCFFFHFSLVQIYINKLYYSHSEVKQMLFNTLIFFREIVKIKSVSLFHSSHSYCFHSHSMYFSDWDVNNITDEEGEETCWGEEEKKISFYAAHELNLTSTTRFIFFILFAVFLFSHEIFDFSGKSLETISLHLICLICMCRRGREREIMWFLRWNEEWVVLTIVVCQVALTRS